MTTLHTLEELHAQQAKNKARFQKLITNRIAFIFFLLMKLPMAFMAGLRVKHLDEKRCEITVPYRWLNKNPFNSTYFAVLSMAAEMSTGMHSMMATYDTNLAVLVTNIEADFVKKATGITTFICEEGDLIFKAAEEAFQTGEGKTVHINTIGRSKDGTEEARFRVTWSFKKRSK